ncbi:DUF1580 domain-containing protein [Pirellulaceae bacterium SH449]
MAKRSARQTAEQSVMNVLSESVVTLKQAQDLLSQATGLRPDKATLCRWIMRGRQGVCLEGVKLGRQWITSTEALNRFLVATTEKALSDG